VTTTSAPSGDRIIPVNENTDGLKNRMFKTSASYWSWTIRVLASGLCTSNELATLTMGLLSLKTATILPSLSKNWPEIVAPFGLIDTLINGLHEFPDELSGVTTIGIGLLLCTLPPTTEPPKKTRAESGFIPYTCVPSGSGGIGSLAGIKGEYKSSDFAKSPTTNTTRHNKTYEPQTVFGRLEYL